MKKIQFKIVQFSHFTDHSGFLFEVNNRQFGLSYTDTTVHVHDLYTGGRVIWFQINDMLQITDENLIEFATFYISKITPQQFENALEKVKQDYSYLTFPANEIYDNSK